MADIKRICSCCGQDVTPTPHTLYVATDLRGNGFALVGTCCGAEVEALLKRLARKYGAYWDTDGVQRASPRGSPTIRYLAHLRQEARA